MGNNSSSSSSSSKWKYGVFLSFFRREGAYDHHFFITNLLAALDENDVKTFNHRQRPTHGQEISQEVRRGIRESNVAVVIFTREYASSVWCLDELVEIIECHRTLDQILIPIFFDVDPSEVRKQTGNFGDEVLASHMRISRISSDKVQKWKAALKTAAGVVGWDFRVNRPDRTHIDQIVKDISKILGHKLEEMPCAPGILPPLADRRIASYSSNWLVQLYVALQAGVFVFGFAFLSVSVILLFLL